jgi:hypothetical protein
LVSLVTNEDSLHGGEEEGGVAREHSTPQTRTHSPEGRRDEQVGELGDVARHKRGLTNWRGGTGRSGLVSSEMWHVTSEDSPTGGEEQGGTGWWARKKRGTTQTRTHPLEGRKREERVGELGNVARHKRGLTRWRGGRGRSGLVSSGTRHVTNEGSLPGGEEEGGAGW